MTNLGSSRWVGYLALGVFGSVIGGLIITLIAGLGSLVIGGPFLFAGTMTSGLFVSIVWLPIYTLIGTGVGLQMARGQAINAHGVRLLPEGELTDVVHDLARRAGLPKMPSVGVYESPDMNAFAAGSSRGSAVVAFSSALLDNAQKEEVNAIAAHEVAHIASNDMLAMGIVRAVQGAMSWYMIFRGLKMLVRRLIFFVTEIGAGHLSRVREYRADAIGAALTSRDDMVAALLRLKDDDARMPRRQRSYASLKIQNPATRTHPPIDKRIEAVRAGRFERAVPAGLLPRQAPVGDATMG